MSATYSGVYVCAYANKYTHIQRVGESEYRKDKHLWIRTVKEFSIKILYRFELFNLK